jgi:parallel beta-helix repeat protein
MNKLIRVMSLAGLLLVLLIPASATLAAPEASSAIFTVTNTSDSGAGSFRQAIIQSNATAGKDTIQFNIAGAGPHVITLSAALQAITDPVIIDGTSQPGASCASWPPALRIVLNGSGAGANTSGLVVTAGNTNIKGLVIQRFSDHGVVLQGSGGNQVDCSFIGTNSTGELAGFGNDIGVYINNSSNNIVSRSVVSGNGTYGIYVSGSGNQIRGSYVGTNKTGSSILANDSAGILVQGAPNTLIGGTSPAFRNVITGNKGHGVQISGAANGTKVQGNYIGTDFSGLTGLGNTGSGVAVTNAPNVTIGGDDADAGNIISGNSAWGIRLQNGASGATIERNIIGRSIHGTFILANGNAGVMLDQAPNNTIGSSGNGNVISGNQDEGVYLYGTASTGNVVQGNAITDNGFFGVRIGFAPGNTIGGTSGGTENTISGNGADGIYVEGGTATGNRLLRNSIFNNLGLGIDLESDGVAPNDAGDGDSGANGLQNYPVLTSAASGGNLTTVKGTLNSQPNSEYRLEFFFGDVGACDPSGNGEGRTFLGAGVATTNGSGNVSFTFVSNTSLGAGRLVAATATDAAGNTSEFSACRNIVLFVPKTIYLPLAAR